MAEADNRPADLLYGVGAISEFLGVKRRAAYHLIATNRIPHFKIGKTVCARRTAVAAALEQLEAGGGVRDEVDA
jgi:excisionase family DNA binding protein